jgi:hypothetical protein
MDYPTKKQIDSAPCAKAFEWYRSIPMPRSDSEYRLLARLFDKVWLKCNKEQRNGV